MLSPGTMLENRYEIQAAIGQGGMGAVYRARDCRLGTMVAVKQTFYPAGVGRGAFAREARLLATLDHPALVRVTDYFPEDGGAYLVMELVDGQDLRGRLNELGGPCALPDVLDWADQLLAALEYLHTQDPPVIHRDIKPDNVKLLSDGRVKLLDFGLAKGMSPRPFHLDSVISVPESIHGGTGYYASPEQLTGQGTDARSDLYSMGATLYELLTAQRPPDARLREYALTSGIHDPLRPAGQLNEALPTAVADVIVWALEMKPGDRPQTAAELRTALRAASERAPRGDPAPNPLPGPAPSPNPSPSPTPEPGPGPSPSPTPKPAPSPTPARGPIMRVLAALGVAAVEGPIKIVVLTMAAAIFAFVGGAVGGGLGAAILQPILDAALSPTSSRGLGTSVGVLLGAGFGIYQIVTHWDEW